MSPGPSVEPTRTSALVIAGVVGAGLAWVGLSVAESFGWPIPPVPWLTAVVIGVLALSAWLAARWMRRTVREGRQSVEPARAVALLLAGKAALIGGAALAGGYLAVALRNLPHVDVVLPRERALASALAAVLSVLLMLAGRSLERACQVPRPPEGQSGDAPGGDGPVTPGAG